MGGQHMGDVLALISAFRCQRSLRLKIEHIYSSTARNPEKEVPRHRRASSSSVKLMPQTPDTGAVVSREVQTFSQ